MNRFQIGGVYFSKAFNKRLKRFLKSQHIHRFSFVSLNQLPVDKDDPSALDDFLMIYDESFAFWKKYPLRDVFPKGWK